MHRWFLLGVFFSIVALPTPIAHANHCAAESRVLLAKARLSEALAIRARTQGDLGTACRHRAQALQQGRALLAYLNQPKCDHPNNFSRQWGLESLGRAVERLDALRQRDCTRQARSS
jgi:hypothetical protein